MKESKKKLKNEKDTDIIEVNEINVLESGSLSQDILNFDKNNKFYIENKEVPELELKEIVISKTGNYLNVQENIVNIPNEMIIFPFFSPQKQNKRMNFKYTFKDLGVIMHSTLILKDKKDQVFQPSTFEEKIYMFLIDMYNKELNENEKKKKEMQKNNEIYEEKEIVLEFEISDFIVKFLGNKMNRNYYAKVEQALKNLKNTQYQFEVSSHSKLGKNQFEDKEFKLLTYQKLKTGKKIFYRVFLDKNIVNKLKSKRFIKFNMKNLLEIMTKDHIASRIYQYISKVRYEESGGEINIRTIAAIIPLKIEQITERETKSGVKRYLLSRMKQVLIRILKAFNVLKKMGYIKEYEERFSREEDTYYISYVFNKNRDGDCHVSEHIKNNKKKNIVKENIGGEEEYIDLNKDFPILETIEDYKKRAKENLKIANKWNKRVENKIDSIIEKDGEALAKRILIILKDVETDINSTLVKYIDGIYKNLIKSKDLGSTKNLSLFKNVNKEKGVKSKNQIKQSRKREINKIDNFQNLIQDTKFDTDSNFTENNIEHFENTDTHINNNKNTLDIFYNFDELTKIEIEKKALALIEKETGQSASILLSFKENSQKTFYLMLENYILKVIKEENME